MSKTIITAIQAFTDNYIWVISATQTNEIALVDPGDAEVCIEYIEAQQAILTDILITHHHPDHVGGIERLAKYCQQKQWPLTIYGPAHENIPLCDVKLVENDSITLSMQTTPFHIIDLPGHTSGHIAYVSDQHLFCGDTLFSAGCGRLFEGTAEQMYQSLNKLAALPEHVAVFCAHEYTLANITFALQVDPNNSELQQYHEKVKQLRAAHKASIPTTIATEKMINPFLRCHTTNVQQSASEYSKQTLTSPVETFSAIRQWKNHF